MRRTAREAVFDLFCQGEGCAEGCGQVAVPSSLCAKMEVALSLLKYCAIQRLELLVTPMQMQREHALKPACRSLEPASSEANTSVLSCAHQDEL